MRKETVNTFTKGLIKDTHPLTTPADVLTDCLNGTIITYNGNEMILLNDRGNVKIGSAELPAGYIPVGITEYGGIIYVASYNPETGKSLIGSFPSPQLNHMSELWSVNVEDSPTIGSINLNTLFYTSASSEDIIKTEVRYPLTSNLEGDTIYTLHTGDKLLILHKVSENSFISIPELLGNDAKYVRVQLGIVKSDNSIELLEDQDYLDGEEHVYTGKSSGTPILIFKLLTLTSFNLERAYSRGIKLNDLDTVTITFTGRFEKEAPETKVTLEHILSGEDIPSGEDISDATSFRVSNLNMDGNLHYIVTPILNPLGRLVSMLKEGYIDLSKFKNDTKDFRNWSYLILNNYIKINWSFDYYNLDENSDIKKVIFKFINIADGSSYDVDIEKDSYNGSFEEIINFDEHIQRNKIYIVEIQGKTSTNTNVHLGNRFVYTSGIFNEYYGKVRDFTNKGFKEALGSEVIRNFGGTEAFRKTIKVNIEAVVKANKESNTVTITDPFNNVTTTTINNITGSTFTNRVTGEDSVSGFYDVDVVNNYSFTVDLKASTIADSTIVGTPAEATIKKILESYAGSKLQFTDESQKFGVLTNLAANPIPNILLAYQQVGGTYAQGETYNTGTLTYNSNLALESLMKVLASSIKTTVEKFKKLMPLYHNNLSNTLRDRVFTGWDKEKLRMAAGSYLGILYNAMMKGTELYGGEDAGAGCDDMGLITAMAQMNNPMCSIFAGIEGDACAYGFDGELLSEGNSMNYPRQAVAGWSSGDGDVLHYSDNYLITVWKRSDGNYNFTTLGSPRHTKDEENDRLLRLDYMLRCLLSQIFIKQAVNQTVKYITSSPDQYGYYLPNIEVSSNLESSTLNYNDVLYNESSTTNYDILLGDLTIEECIDNVKDQVEELKEDEYMTIKYEYILNDKSTSLVFTNDSGIQDIASSFNGSAYQEAYLDDKSSPNLIYVPNWSRIDESTNIYEVTPDKTIEWKLDDMTPYLKLSGDPDTFGYTYVGENGLLVYKFGGHEELRGEVYDGVVNNMHLGGFNFGDILRTWNGKPWPFYRSFQHAFITTCARDSSDVDENEPNEMLINFEPEHTGYYTRKGYWINDQVMLPEAPDMVPCLANDTNSLFGRNFSGHVSDVTINNDY